MSLVKVSLWTATNALVKIGAGSLVVKLLAVPFDPVGVGQTGNLRQTVTVLGIPARADVFSGVTKCVVRYHDSPTQFRKVAGTSSAMVLGFSTPMAVVFLLAAAPINQGLFSRIHYRGLVRPVALVQMGIAWVNLLLMSMKGFHDMVGNALSLIAGSLVGVMTYYGCYRLGGYEGALLDLTPMPALVVTPAAIMLIRCGAVLLHHLESSWDNGLAGQLSKFILMALITSVTPPAVHVMMRNLPMAQYSWDDAGVWQGVSSISGVHLQFITASFSVYLFPTSSRLTEGRDITREVVKSLKSASPVAAATSSTVWLPRDFSIWLLFPAKFTAIRDLFTWQLAGDVSKVGTHVFGYLVTMKASLWLYILVEISQFMSLTVFTYWPIPAHGVLGMAQVYMATYAVYFSFCCGVLSLWCGRV